jgi:hypothetical protein
MFDRYRLLAGLFVLDVALFALAGAPAFKNAHHGVRWILGGIGWFGALLTTLVLIVLALVILAKRVRYRRARLG